jgi:hypothetical protein
MVQYIRTGFDASFAALSDVTRRGDANAGMDSGMPETFGQLDELLLSLI